MPDILTLSTSVSAFLLQYAPSHRGADQREYLLKHDLDADQWSPGSSNLSLDMLDHGV
jgi:hypothetical protein